MPSAFWRHVWSLGFEALWQPQVMVVAALVLAGYLLLSGPLSRSRPPAERASPLQRALFVLMVVVLYLTFGSPVDWLSDHAFFSVHSVEHVVDALVLPPLFLYGLPRWTVRAVLGWRPLGAVWRALTRPAVALLIWGGVLSVWHVPSLYEWTLVNDTVHFTEHATIFMAGLAFWWPALSPLENMPRLGDLALTLHFLLGNLVCWPLFFVLSLYPGKALYPFYIHVYRAWGVVSPRAFAFADQQRGGMVMMAAMMVILGGQMAAAFFRWCSTDEAYRQATADGGSA